MAKAKQGFTVTDKRRAAQPEPVAPKVNFTPLGSKCLLWRIPEAEGIIELADSAKEKPLEAEVIAVSATGLSEFDTKALALLKPGDKVLVRKNSGTEIKVDGHELTIIHVQDILGRF